jgi:hypothetical protein
MGQSTFGSSRSAFSACSTSSARLGHPAVVLPSYIGVEVSGVDGGTNDSPGSLHSQRVLIATIPDLHRKTQVPGCPVFHSEIQLHWHRHRAGISKVHLGRHAT